MKTPIADAQPPLSGGPPVASGTSTSRRSKVWALLPTACAIHCLLAPVLVAALPLIHIGEVIEPFLLAISVVIGGLESRSGFRVHRRWQVGAVVVLGASVWAASLMGLFLPWAPEPFTSAAGGLLVAAALFWNGRLRHALECAQECSCPAPH